MTDRLDLIARAICREQCAFYGEPPCFDEMFEGDSNIPIWPNEFGCCKPGCHALAKAVMAAVGMPTKSTQVDLADNKPDIAK